MYVGVCRSEYFLVFSFFHTEMKLTIAFVLQSLLAPLHVFKIQSAEQSNAQLQLLRLVRSFSLSAFGKNPLNCLASAETKALKLFSFWRRQIFILRTKHIHCFEPQLGEMLLYSFGCYMPWNDAAPATSFRLRCDPAPVRLCTFPTCKLLGMLHISSSTIRIKLLVSLMQVHMWLNKPE